MFILAQLLNDELNIQMEGNTTILSSQLFDMSGKSFNAEIIDNKLNVSHLQHGMYILTLKTDKGMVAKRFIKK